MITQTQTTDLLTGAARLSVDFPEHHERITSPRYTVRVAAPEGFRKVEVSIDHTGWQPCRYAVGYWWFDWSGYQSGRHELVARLQAPDGRTLALEPRRFFVELDAEKAAKTK